MQLLFDLLYPKPVYFRIDGLCLYPLEKVSRRWLVPSSESAQNDVKSADSFDVLVLFRGAIGA